MIRFISREQCSACGACQNICPVESITMKEDDYGYIFPHIDEKSCIECNKCVETCKQIDSLSKNIPRISYASFSKSKSIRFQAAAGGAVYEFAKFFLENGGVVYGCVQKNYKTFRIERITSFERLPDILNSKLVQSEIGYSFRNVKDDLENNLNVLFTGLPCQVGGLRAFLDKDYKNLLTVDIGCLGVVPVKMLEDQIRSYNEIKKYKTDEIKVQFRWKYYKNDEVSTIFGLRTLACVDNKTEIIKEEENKINHYKRCYDNIMRDSCYSCRYPSLERFSDITVANFWQIGKKIPSSFKFLNGVSNVMPNTEKGKEYFELIKNNISFEVYESCEAAKYDGCLKSHRKKDIRRDDFLKLYRKKGFIKAAKTVYPIKYFEKDNTQGIKYLIKRILIKYINKSPFLIKIYKYLFKK